MITTENLDVYWSWY